MKDYTSNKKSKYKKLFCVIALAVITLFLFTSCNSQPRYIPKELEELNIFDESDLIGTWVSPDAYNQVLEIRTEEIRFNYRVFDYTVEDDVLSLYQTFPNDGGVAGDMPFELKGDKLYIQLGEDFEGYFYGRSGIVELERE